MNEVGWYVVCKINGRYLNISLIDKIQQTVKFIIGTGLLENFKNNFILMFD